MTAPERTQHHRKSNSSTSSIDNEKEKALTRTTSAVLPQSPTTYPDLEAATASDFPLQIPKNIGIVRYKILNIYRRLFTIAFIGNSIALIVLLAQRGRDTTPLDLINASAINLAVCGLARQPLVINTLYHIFGCIPRTAPLFLRRLAVKIFHFGGVHSGTGVASLLWYIAFVVLYSLDFFRPLTSTTPEARSAISIAALSLIYLVLAIIFLIIAVAYPPFRAKHHDIFELTHRFANWFLLLTFWALLFLLANQTPSTSQFLLNLPAFWILIILTCATIHPWLFLRKITITPEPLSQHAIRLHFNHTPLPYGKGISLAKHPLKDWHSFAGFTDSHDTPDSQFSVLVSKAGDWTRETIQSAPTTLYKRGTLVFGFGYVMKMFSRLIVVTTGSGIGPCLSFIGLDDETRPKMRVVWQTRDPIKTYGERTMDLVKIMDKDPIVLDTTLVGGRKDMLPVVLGLYKDFGAEAVCIVSNPATTKRLVLELEMRGILAYGPLFDS
ncbi:hypothetical protein V8F33_012702 [Rhypophila sp. PSN 637]